MLKKISYGSGLQLYIHKDEVEIFSLLSIYMAEIVSTRCVISFPKLLVNFLYFNKRWGNVMIFCNFR